jgi:hypothetical protein
MKIRWFTSCYRRVADCSIPVLLLWVATGCAPNFPEEGTLITTPQLIAAIAEPAEARPRQEVHLRVIGAPGNAHGSLDYDFCTTPANVGDPRPVAEACLTETGVPLVADGLTADGTVPADACARFGPDPPPGNYRPRDPDATGGFYQPIRIRAFGNDNIESLRILCALPDAPADLARELADRYVPNQNPPPPTLERLGARGWESFDEVDADASVTLRASFGTDSRELYVLLPPQGGALEERTEGMSVSWFSTAGHFAEAVTGRAEDEAGENTTNQFATPPAGPLTIWVVLRDSRGGSSFLQRSISAR